PYYVWNLGVDKHGRQLRIYFVLVQPVPNPIQNLYTDNNKWRDRYRINHSNLVMQLFECGFVLGAQDENRIKKFMQLKFADFLIKRDTPQKTSELEEFSQLDEEGYERIIAVTTHERSRKNREAAICKHGIRCFGCQKEMNEVYGSIADGFIHIHHVQPLSLFDETEIPDIDDLIPLCPNCHAVVHMEEPPITVDRLRELISEALAKQKDT
ncbi:MAG: hypothetical protein F4X92_04985, partial [Gammaproteobacteria bacterium]|nr:hypothetical protein [Gammaproteobacteria bacterium]